MWHGAALGQQHLQWRKWWWVRSTMRRRTFWNDYLSEVWRGKRPLVLMPFVVIGAVFALLASPWWLQSLGLVPAAITFALGLHWMKSDR